MVPPTVIPLSFPLRDVAVALLDLESLGEREGERFLTGRERGEYRLLKSGTRRREWLGARVCLKTMLLESGKIGSPGECEVLKDAGGRPSVACAGDCSLSHKGKYAAAALTFAEGMRVGVDIEKISPRVTRLRGSFVNPGDSLPGVTGADRLHTVLWTAKEAASKVLGTGLGAGLADLVCRQAGEGRCMTGRGDGAGDIEGAFLFLEDYTVTVGLGRVPSQGHYRQTIRMEGAHVRENSD